MRSRMIVIVVALAAAMAFASAANGQIPDEPREAQRNFGERETAPSVSFPDGWKPCPRCQNNLDRARENQTYKVAGHSFDPHDLTGVWGWDGIGNAFRDGKGAPPFTPEGKALFDATIGEKAPDGKAIYSKDTSGRGAGAKVNCDPYGWPRLYQYNYGFEFAMFPDHIVQFFELNHTWRTIWTDGRKLPDEPPSLKWMGWNVGHWEGDTLVVESSGYDERSWLSQAMPDGGWIHSDQMKVVERWRRTGYATLESQITVTDPKVYTKPWTVQGVEHLVPGAELGEEFCIPSDYNQFNDGVFSKAAGTKQ